MTSRPKLLKGQHAFDCMLAKDCELEQLSDACLDGWFMSEKLDGVRARFCAETKTFWSRPGRDGSTNQFCAPSWFAEAVARFALGNDLDGELWMGRGRFQDVVGAVRRDVPREEDWSQIRYMVYDLPRVPTSYLARLRRLEALHIAGCGPSVEVLPQVQLYAPGIPDTLREQLESVVAQGAEGLMVRSPNALYEAGKRSGALLKVKPWKDSEAVVVGHEPGKGNRKGMAGALRVQWQGREFKIGTGMTHEVCKAPPGVGEIVRFTYTELTRDGVPKCAAFAGVRPEGC